MDRRRKLCSAHPSKARNPFWAGEKAEHSIAQEAIRLAIMAEYSLYTVSCRLMGLQFLMLAGCVTPLVDEGDG